MRWLVVLLAPGALACATGVDTTPDEDPGGSGGETSTSTGSGGGSGGGPQTCVTAGDCAAFGDACNDPVCGEDLLCTTRHVNEMGACDDGKYCTQGDHCEAGQCVGSSTTECPSSDPCQVGTCNPTTQLCEAGPGNDGATCDDGDPCTATSSCSAGTCQPGAATNCDFLADPCNVGVCDPQAGCVKMPANEGQPCDDGLFCTVLDSCAGGACKGVANPCTSPGANCVVAACDEVSDSCTTAVAPNGTSCDDGSSCTTGESCAAGVCGGGAPANQGGACDDGSACSLGDSCNAGVCSGTPVVACLSGDGCCPAGCQGADDDCTCTTNVAIGAVGSISSGGNQPPYLPSEMNNGVGEGACQWSWIDNSTVPTGAWFELDWAAPVVVGSLYLETENATLPKCGNAAGRNIASATVQYWDGAAWVTATSFSNQLDDVQIDLPSQITTTKLRLYDVTTAPGNGNSVLYEWHVYTGTGCTPPP